jgi:CheY-like chemotaxis protein
VSRRRVLVVVPDLFFATRIAATAEHLGVAIHASDAASATEGCGAEPPDLVILDLHGPGALDVARALKAGEATRAIPLVAHVDRELRVAALAAGVDQVLPRSAFTAQLPEILAGAGDV